MAKSRSLVAAMNLAVVAPAQRDRELITDLAPEGRVLCKPQMVGIARLPATDQTRLLGHIPDVIAVSNSARLWEGEGALVDRLHNPFGPRPLSRRYPRRRGFLSPAACPGAVLRIGGVHYSVCPELLFNPL